MPGFVTYGPLVVNPAVFSGRLTIFEGSWVDQPDMSAISLGKVGAIAANVSALRQTVSNSPRSPAWNCPRAWIRC